MKILFSAKNLLTFWIPIAKYRRKARKFISKNKIKNKIKEESLIEKGIIISKKANINLSVFASYSKNIDIDDYSYMNNGDIVGPTSIGKFCSIAKNVLISPSKHPIDAISTHPFFYQNKNFNRKSIESEKTIIKNDVWIGRNAVIMPGITIGNGAVIGASAVVTKNVPDYAIVTGAPAKIIRYRFNEEIIKDLLELQWWNLPEEYLIKIEPNNIKESIDFLKKIIR